MNEERRKILKMVEDGIISSEEAEELFDSLEKADQAKYYVSKQVDWENGEKYQSSQANKTKSSKKAKVLSFIEETFTKIKNVDLDFNFGAHEQVSHIFQSQQVNFSKMDIDISNGSLSLVPWDEADVRIECEAKVYQVESHDQGRQKFLNDAEFQIEDGILHFIIPSKQIKADVTLKVPQKFYEKVNARLFNGPINAKNMNVNHLLAKTINGPISINKIKGESHHLETASGMIKVEHAVAEELEAETINGSVRLDGQFEKVDAQVVNGSIHCAWDGERPHTAFFKTTTGSIRLNVPANVKIDGKAETNIGSIHCHLASYKVFDKKNEMMKRVLHFEANDQFDSTLHMEAETKTGSIWLFPNE